MPLQWSTVPVTIRAGVDTKTEDKSLPITSLNQASNVVMTETGIVKSRNGYDNLSTTTLDSSTISASEQLMTYRDELLLADGQKLYSYSDSGWVDKGGLISGKVTTKNISDFGDVDNHSYARGVTTEMFIRTEQNSGFTYYIMDQETGQCLYNATISDAGIDETHVTFVTDTYCIFYRVGSTINHRRVDEDDLTSISSAVSTVTDCRNGVISEGPMLQVTTHTNSGTWAFLAYCRSSPNTDIRLYYVDPTAGTIDPSGPPAGVTEGYPAQVLRIDAIEWSTGGTLGVLSTETNSFPTGSTMRFKRFDNSALTVDSTTPSIGATTGWLNATFHWDNSASLAYVYLTDDGTTAAGYNVLGYTATESDTAPLTAQDLDLWGYFISGHSIETTYGNVVPCSHGDSAQRQTVWFRSDGKPVARHSVGFSAHTQSIHNFLGPTYEESTGKYSNAFLQYLTTAASTSFDNIRVGKVTLEMNTTDAYQWGEFNDTLYISGMGIIWAYDGKDVKETGFFHFPEEHNLADSIGGSLDASADYNYNACYTRWDSNGRRLQSAVSGGWTDSTTTNRILSFDLTTYFDSDARLTVFRTEGDEADPFYTHPTYDSVTNTPATELVSISDSTADSLIISEEQLYTGSGELDNTPPLVGNVLGATRTKLFVAGFEENDRIQYSKDLKQKTQVEFNEVLTTRVEAKEGPVTAVAELDDKVIVFKRDQIYALVGPGVNNLGGGVPQAVYQVASDVGCTNARTVVLVPQGLMFLSEKGFYLLQRNLSVVYIGAAVEQYNSGTYTAATLLDDRNMVVFLAASGSTTVVFDYAIGQWMTWSIVGDGAVNWQGLHTYVLGGTVRQEDVGSTDDAGTDITMSIQTGFVYPAFIVPGQGVGGPAGSKSTMSRCKRVTLIGKFAANEQISFAMDSLFETDGGGNFAENSSITPTAERPFLQFYPERQKAIAFAVQVQGTGFELNQVDFHVGVKGPMHKLPVGNTAGNVNT